MNTKCLDLEEYLNEKRSQIEQKLGDIIPEKAVPHANLYKAARHTLLGGGKRLRPILALAVAESLSDFKPSGIPLSVPCALELVHTYSMIHDDLPCMDDDDYRRGKPTIHKLYNEGLAVLTGDYLLTKAFEVIANEPLITAEQKVAIISLLAKYSGDEGMVGGQVLDIELTGQNLDLNTLRMIHLNKTAAPIIAAAECGGILAHVPAAQLQALRLFATQLGLAYQIIDDILDLESTQEKLGKPVGSDAENGKYTYVNIMGTEQAKEAAEYLFLNAVESLNAFPNDTTLIKEIASLMIHRIN